MIMRPPTRDSDGADRPVAARRRRPTVVSLFTGAGGLDLGLEMAGFKTVAALDNDPCCIETLRTNKARRIGGPNGVPYLGGTQIVAKSVADVSASELQPNCASRSWRPDVLAGGPPCQPFSSAGKQLSLDDPRGRLFEHFVRIAKELKPRYILFENVRGIVTARGPSGDAGEVIHLIRDAFEAIDYGTNFALLNAADFGLPQRRVRCFMLAARMGPVPDFPSATHDARGALFGAGDVRPWETLGTYLASRPAPGPDELVLPSARLAQELTSVPAGSGLKSPGAREATRPGGHWGYKQGTFIADPTKPARTVTAAATQDWVRTSAGTLRRLTLRECAGLQGFPEDWEFVGRQAARFRQVGNAVPTVFGLVLGSVLRDAVHEYATSRTPSESRTFPASFDDAIHYTRKEIARNGASRARVRSVDAAERGHLKGLGSADRATELPLFDRQPV